MWLLYQIAVCASLAVLAPWTILRRGGVYLETLRQRLGRDWGDSASARAGERPLWLHAVSVGEVGVAEALARALPEDLPLLVTTVTPTGQERAHNSFKTATVTYLPIELGVAIDRFFRRFDPRALVLAEGDLWPLILKKAKARDLPVVVVNGRVSQRSFRRMKTLRRFLAPILSPVDHFAVQTDTDRNRLLELGVEPHRVTTTGNLKFDSPTPAPNPALENQIRELAGKRGILVAGSTMDGEDEQVVEAFAKAGDNGRDALLILAPRHPERWNAVAALVAERGLTVLRRSELENERPEPASAAVLLLDTMGELASLYRLARAAFVGGTLVPTGGHNPLEPARFAVPIAVGPSMTNFAEIAEAFDRANAWRRVENAAELGRVWRSWLELPDDAATLGQRSGELVASNRGAVARTLDVILPFLENTETNPLTVPEPPRSPWQRIYGGGHRLRRSWHHRRARSLPRPVISIGSLHWGGAGKTPLVAAIASWLDKRGLEVVILSRGYRRQSQGVQIVSSGEEPLLGPRTAGDEPVMLAEELRGVGVVVGADRYRAGIAALERLPKTPDVFVLDDGFSHVRLHRDLDLLVFPPSDPLGGGRLPPSGRLREPLASARDADALLWAGASPEAARDLADGLARYGFSGPGFASRSEALAARIERDRPLPDDARVFLVTGIARPERVRRSLAGFGYQVLGELNFPDHHPYPPESLRKIESALAASGADWVLTTSKDHVKLLGKLEAPLARLPLRARPEPEFFDWLGARLDTTLESAR